GPCRTGDRRHGGPGPPASRPSASSGSTCLCRLYSLSYSTFITPTPTARFEHLLSSRALIGWGAPVATARPVASPLYEFGGGYPDPASFPYDDMVEATARMMKAEGAQALTYGDPQGYRGLRELVCHT